MGAYAEKIAHSIFGRVLQDIKPTRRELKESVYNINQITTRLKKLVPKEVEVRVVGSVVRSTQLRGESDIDVFLLFPRKYSRDKITKDGLRYAKSIVKGKDEEYEIKYAEHPYARVFIHSLNVKADIVPAFKIDNIEEMGTAVDRSPMHADYINAHLSERQRDEVRLLKYLLNAHNIYGAEVKTSGFSGYLCELLVYQYGSLFKLLQNATEFRLPIALDPKNRLTLNDQTIFKKFNSKFIVIDPVDPNRNVAAGVSPESFARFVTISSSFIKRPSIKSFFVGGFPVDKVKELMNSFAENSGLDIFTIISRVPDKSEDILWPQLRKISEYVVTYAEKLGFKIYFAIPVIKGNESLLVFLAPNQTIKTRMLRGPSAFMPKAREEFLKTHREAIGITFVEDSVYVLDKNRYAHLYELMKDVAAGKVLKAHKDIKLTKSKLFYNTVPSEYMEVVYSELLNRLRV